MCPNTSNLSLVSDKHGQKLKKTKNFPHPKFFFLDVESLMKKISLLMTIIKCRESRGKNNCEIDFDEDLSNVCNLVRIDSDNPLQDFKRFCQRSKIWI